MKRRWIEQRLGAVGRRRATFAALALGAVLSVLFASPAGTEAEQASQPAAAAAGQLDVSGGAGDMSGHSCARLEGGELRCWGFGGDGRLGYGNTDTIGDDETPGAVAPVDVGTGRTAQAISVGGFHTCGLLDDARVRCWGFGGEGRLGYGNQSAVGDDEAPGARGPVNLGPGARALAMSAGGGHSCALLDGGSVRCWGFGGDGRLGYGNNENIGDNEVPGSQRAIDLGTDADGAPVGATAISAGQDHTCAVLDGGSVRCWGFGSNGQLGYGNSDTIGENETPVGTADKPVGPVDLGSGRSATAISAGDGHTCAVLDGGDVRCWGFGGNGRLGYGNTMTIGDSESPGDFGPVALGGPAVAVSAGDNHTCALLEGGSVRCWGFGGDGRLGYANANDIGDDETPAAVPPVDLGSPAVAISAGGRHTCALLNDGNIRCWGDSDGGRLGYCNKNDIGDDEAPTATGPVNVTGASGCAMPPPPDPGPRPAPPPARTPEATPGPTATERLAARLRRVSRRALAAERRRAGALSGCHVRVKRHARFERRRARRLDGARPRFRALRHLRRHRARGWRACRRRHARTPGRVTGLRARAVSKRKVVLRFRTPGSAGRRPPAARQYVVKQSRRPIRGRRRFRRAPSLCDGRCRFNVRIVGAALTLTVTELRPGTTYYYAIAARDNVSGRAGPRSKAIRVRTRR